MDFSLYHTCGTVGTIERECSNESNHSNEVVTTEIMLSICHAIEFCQV